MRATLSHTPRRGQKELQGFFKKKLTLKFSVSGKTFPNVASYLKSIYLSVSSTRRGGRGGADGGGEAKVGGTRAEVGEWWGGIHYRDKDTD